MQHIKNYIDGQMVPPEHGQYLDVFNPAVGSAYAKSPASDQADVQRAVAAAERAFPTWSGLSATARSQWLEKIASEIEQRAEPLARAESLDNGKPIRLARTVDMPRASANFRFFAQAITQFATQAHEMNQAINYTLRQPLGVVATISPWNLPLYLFTWKIAPALAVGNTVVAKPSEVTPMTAYLLAEICSDLGLPPGVLNIVHGDGIGVGRALTQHPSIKAISFTGSTRVGREIAEVAAPAFKKISLEMGGKNPNLIFADCDYEKMLDTTLRSSFANQGQICLCGSRIFVEKSIYQKFKADFVARTTALKVGPPNHDDADLGAIVSQAHYDKIMRYLALAKEEGGTILAGGYAVHPQDHEQGWYIAPTIIEGLSTTARCNQEEIFGPVVTLAPFETEPEALQLANGVSYGLSATLWTENLTRAHRLAREIEAGIVWINTWLLRDLRTPFGGVKNSGVGREGGLEALRFFTEAKNVCVAY